MASGDLPQEPNARTVIRAFEPNDAAAVRDLFVLVNRLLSPPHLHAAFKAYIARSLSEEMGRIPAYYAEHAGGFWVACRGKDVVGMFGLEAAGSDAFELRRVRPDDAWKAA